MNANEAQNIRRLARTGPTSLGLELGKLNYYFAPFETLGAVLIHIKSKSFKVNSFSLQTLFKLNWFL